ncbi:MAG: M16 family metallopeptidase [Candidatus Dormibacteria bacterium]
MATVPVHQRALANGLRVVVSPDGLAPVVAVEVWYDVGSRDEEPGRTGFAHLFEHVMFQGSANVAKGEHFALIQEAGGTLNGTTWLDRTNYFETLPSHQLETALWLEADRMGSLLAALDQENLDNQRDVVKNERRQRYDNQPYGTAFERLIPALFPKGHPYDHSTIGSMADLDAASLDDVRAFFQRHYTPRNAIVAITGDVDPEAAFSLVETYFGNIPAGHAHVPSSYPELPPLSATQRIDEREEKVPAERVLAGFRVAPDGAPDMEAIEVAAAVLSAGRAARLDRVLVRERQLAQSVHLMVERCVAGASIAVLDATARSGVPIGEVEAALDAEIDRLAETPPSPEEMERVAALAERGMADSLATVGSRADLLCRAAAAHGDAADVNRALERLLAVTPDAVSEAAARYFRDAGRVVLTYHSPPS